MWGLGVRGEDRSVEERPIGEGELYTARRPRDPRGTRTSAIPQDNSHKIRSARSFTDVRMRRERTKEKYEISSGFGIHLWMGRDGVRERDVPMHQQGKHRLYVCASPARA